MGGGGSVAGVLVRRLGEEEDGAAPSAPRTLPGRWWVRLDSQQAWGLGAWKPPGKELRAPTYRLEACAHFPGLGELSPVGARDEEGES